MTQLSIIIPVYGTAGYLRECLDSILGQPPAAGAGAPGSGTGFTTPIGGFEIIAVNDASPDNCAAILAEYAADPRVRVVTQSDRGGPGAARNAGFAEAAGRYVWFADSDDVVAPGALRAILRRLDETTPDVMLLDFARIAEDLVPDPVQMTVLMGAGSLPDTFTAADLPAVAGTPAGVWSRVYRRDYLERLGLTFNTGWYEDVAFTIPATIAAGRISHLSRVSYHARTRRGGFAITARTDARHFEVFGQYDLAFNKITALGADSSALRGALVTRMIAHYWWLLTRTSRIPKARHREFFARMSVSVRAHAPAGYTPRDKETRTRFALIKADAWGRARTTQRAAAAAGTGSDVARKPALLARRVARVARRETMSAYYAAQRRQPIDENLALYGAYWGRGYRCNPAAIYEKARELVPGVRGVWFVNRSQVANIPAGVDYVVEGSREYYRVLARAKYLVNNVNFSEPFVKRPGQIMVQTHHGTPLKAMGIERYRYPVGASKMTPAQMLRRCDDWDLSVSTSPFNTEVWARAYPCKHETLEVGYPRNDRLATAGPAEAAAARAALGLADGEIAVLYAPTHRDYQSDNEAQAQNALLDVEAFADALGDGYRVLARAHYFNSSFGAGANPRVLDVSGHPDVEALCIAADVLITDYSSIMFDYAYLDRPIAIYATDWQTYSLTRGVTFDLMAYPPGAVATTFSQLIAAFRDRDITGEPAAKARAAFRERFCPHTDGRSAERVVRRMFLGERTV